MQLGSDYIPVFTIMWSQVSLYYVVHILQSMHMHIWPMLLLQRVVLLCLLQCHEISCEVC